MSAPAVTTQARRSVRLAAWARAWRAGTVSYDDVIDETENDEEHLVADAPGTWRDVPLREALRALSKLHPNEIRLVLPAPGDPRGLPGPGPMTGAALVAGEGVVAGQLGLVPQVHTHTSGSGDTFETVVWQAYALATAPPPAGEQSPAEAQAELSAATADAIATLTRLDVATWRPEFRSALTALRRPDAGMSLPPGFSPRARALFASANQLDRILAVTAEMAPGGGVNGYELQRWDEAMRPLTTACRRALMAACNSPLES